ncbi:MAG: hypothetical protein ACO1OF_18005 [Adhaeribacter sp.]
MLSEMDKIEKGEMKLQSFSRPPLKAGDYTVKSQLFVNGKGKEFVPDNTVFSNNGLKFTVAAPRFLLDESLLYSTYPSPGATGAYHTSLPHIIFTRKTLPWERSMEVNNKSPWLTLLVIDEDEMKTRNIVLANVAVEELNPGANSNSLIYPKVTLDDWEKNKAVIRIMEMPVQFFLAIAPSANELDFLAHTKQVDTSDKENAEINPKGWFSCLIANRLPQKGKVNHVFLVSLEGHAQTLTALPAADVNKNIRLVVLNHWFFRESGATFEELIQQLEINTKPLRIDVDELISANDPDGTKNYKSTVTDIAKKAFRNGYMPINHERRTGHHSVSWYRGPLVPVEISTPENYQYANADQALRFDNEWGMFDISYASAWQLGRLLALQSPNFFSALSNWKTASKRDAPLKIAQELLEEEKGIMIQPQYLAEVIKTIESDEVLTDYIIELWNEMLQSNT